MNRGKCKSHTRSQVQMQCCCVHPVSTSSHIRRILSKKARQQSLPASSLIQQKNTIVHHHSQLEITYLNRLTGIYHLQRSIFQTTALYNQLTNYTYFHHFYSTQLKTTPEAPYNPAIHHVCSSCISRPRFPSSTTVWCYSSYYLYTTLSLPIWWRFTNVGNAITMTVFSETLPALASFFWSVLL